MPRRDSPPPNWDAESLARLGKVPDRQLAEQLGCSVGWVRGMRDRLGVRHQRVCAVCGVTLLIQSGGQTACPGECRRQHKYEVNRLRLRRLQDARRSLGAVAVQRGLVEMVLSCSECGRAFNSTAKRRCCPECHRRRQRAASEACRLRQRDAARAARKCRVCGGPVSWPRKVYCSASCSCEQEALLKRIQRARSKSE